MSNCLRMLAFLSLLALSANLLGCARTVEGGFRMERGGEAHFQSRGSRVTQMLQNAGPGDVEVRIVSGRGGEHEASMTLRPADAVNRDRSHRLDASIRNSSDRPATIEYRARASEGIDVRYDGRVLKDYESNREHNVEFPKDEDESRDDS